jgi:hypothetical protein
MFRVIYPTERNQCPFIQEVSNEASDVAKAKRLWKLSAKLVGLD